MQVPHKLDALHLPDKMIVVQKDKHRQDSHMHNLLWVFLLFLVSIGSSLKAEDVVQSGIIENEEIIEASGLAASTLNDTLLWILNDSGNDACLYAVGVDGSDLGKITIGRVNNYDWEDLVSFRWNDTSFLLIADVGDNNARREFCRLYFIVEPSINENGFFDQTVDVYQQFEFTYETGPCDCEAVAVDPVQEKIFLLSKNQINSKLFELPLTYSAEPPMIARQIATASSISNVTAMDISSYNLISAVMNYQNIFLFYRQYQESWRDVFRIEPVVIRMPSLPGAEAACFNKNGTSVYFTSERVHQPLYRLDIINAPIDSIPPYPPQNIRLIEESE